MYACVCLAQKFGIYKKLSRTLLAAEKTDHRQTITAGGFLLH